MRRRDERGAIAVLTAGLMGLLLVVAAFVVDIGMQRVARRDLQALADVVALDLARFVDGRRASEVQPDLDRELPQSQERNDIDVVGDPDELELEPYLVIVNDDGEYPTTDNGTPQEVSEDEMPNAVVVVAATEVEFGFAGAVGVGSGGSERFSVATSRSSACFHLGSYAAAIAPPRGAPGLAAFLDDLLGFGLGDSDYQTLAVSEVALADVAQQPAVGSVDELLGEGLPVADFLAAVSGAVREEPDPTDAATIEVLGRMAEHPELPADVDVGGWVAIEVSDDAALAAEVNVLDLVAGVLVAAGAEPRPGLPPELQVTQAQQRACGVDARATSSSVEVDVTVSEVPFEQVQDDLRPQTVWSGIEISGTTTMSGGFGGAEGTLAGPPRCEPDGARDAYDVDVAAGETGVSTTASLTLSGEAEFVRGRFAGIVDFEDVVFQVDPVPTAVAVDETAPLVVPDNAYNAQPRGVPRATGEPVPASLSPPQVVRANASGNVTVVPDEGEPYEVAVGEIGNRRLANLLQQINTDLAREARTGTLGVRYGQLRDYASLLGVTVGGANVFGVFRPTCNGVRLSGATPD